jgi:hypothetical protein
MKVFVFDLLAYGEQLEHLKVGNELPYPLPNRYFKPEVAARTYAEHLEAWEELDRLGYDGVGFNEHHCSPYGLINSPNLWRPPRSAKEPRLLIYGNLLPCTSCVWPKSWRCRPYVERPADSVLPAAFREYQVHNVPWRSRARSKRRSTSLPGWTRRSFL